MVDAQKQGRRMIERTNLATGGFERRAGRERASTVYRLARWSFPALVVAVAASLVGGLFYAAFHDVLPERPPAEPYECLNPPCFIGGPPPGLRDLPVVASLPVFLFATALALPGLVVGPWRLLRGHANGAGLLLAFVGIIFVIVYQELGAHLPYVCQVAPGLCENAGEHGLGLSDRWHQFGHAAFGGGPALAVYAFVWRKWGRIGRAHGEMAGEPQVPTA
jgi:hypothetical protein